MCVSMHAYVYIFVCVRIVFKEKQCDTLYSV